MSSPKRLHPAAMIFTVITTIRQLIVAALPLIVLANGDGVFLYFLLGAIVFVLALIVYGILSWYRYVYWVEDDQLRIEQGVIIRKKRTIAKNRIQSIDLTQGVIHRIFGLTKVQIETAGSDRNVDATLSAVTFEEGKLLHEQLKQKSEPTDVQLEQSTEPKETISRSITIKQLILAGSTSGSFGVILSLFVLVFSELESLIPDTIYEQATSWIVLQALEVLIVIAIVILLLLWGLGILGTVIKFGNFTIARFEKDLYITRGLLEKRQMTIPLKRIQAVGVKQSLIRQPLGFATVFVEIAGGVQENNNNTETLLFPLLKKSEVPTFLQEILPEYEQFPERLIHLPKRALPYYWLRLSFIPLIASIVVVILYPKWVFIPAVAFVLTSLLAYASYRTTGYYLSEDQLTLQFRLFSKETVLVKQRRVQSLEKKQHVLHRKQRLANLKPSILNNFGGKHYSISELEQTDVDRVSDWFSYRKQ